MKAKILVLFFVTLCAAGSSMAQIKYIPATARRFSLGAGVGATMLFGDVETRLFRPAGRLNFDFNITPFISLGLEGQFGGLAAGDQNKKGKSGGRYSSSTYGAGNINAKLSLGLFGVRPKNAFSKAMSGAYFGAGVGFVTSHVNKIVRVHPRTEVPFKGIVETANHMTVPINVGINFELPPKALGLYNAQLNLNYQHNFVQGENLDGYNLNYATDQHNDSYGFLSVGIKWNFGPFGK